MCRLYKACRRVQYLSTLSKLVVSTCDLSLFKMFTCKTCAKVFTLRNNLLRHVRESGHKEKKRVFCSGCKRGFSSNYNLKNHVSFTCRRNHKTPQTEPEPGTSSSPPPLFFQVETSVKSRLQTFAVQPPSGDIPTVLNLLKSEIIAKIIRVLQTVLALKFNLFLEAEFVHPTGETCTRSFKTRNVVAYRTTDISNLLSTLFDKLNMEKTECELKGSGWTFVKLTRLELRVNKYNPLRGARFIQLPAAIAATKSVINVQNTDEFCFKYAIMSKYVDTHKLCRVSNYLDNPEVEGKYVWDCIDYPVKLNDLKHFESRNNVSINVFGLDEQSSVYPLKVCEEELEDHFDLLYVTSESTSHYCLITDFNKLVRHQLTKYCRKVAICKKCFTHYQDLNGIPAEERLADHKRFCSSNEAIRCEFPSYDSIKFKNAHRSKKVRFVVYADFETSLVPLSGCVGNPQLSWSNAYQQHVPYSYAYLIKDAENEHTVLRQYRGPDASKHFMKSMVEDIQVIDTVLYGDKKLQVPVLTSQQQEEFDNAEECHICKKGDFSPVNGKVRNHCHVTGDYLGAAHRHCNLFYQDQHFIPCFIHNLSGYDSHFIVRELGYDTGNIRVIPNSEEKYISFSKCIKVKHATHNFIDLRFLDSYRFMASSLASLADNLPDEEFHQTRKEFPEDFPLLTKKGVFPYDYVTDEKKLDETELPPKVSFYNKLNDEEISDSMYQHAERIWKHFNVKSLGEYSDIYLKSDVLILCDTFEKFRTTCMETYDLDPAYYFTVPGLAWDAMLKYTGVEIELMKDMDMILMMEKGIRGGITQCVKRHSVANNKYIPELHLKELPSKYLLYLDANALYAWAMSQPLPYADFQWCEPSEEILATPEDGEEGYILEVDINYPKELHDDHSDFPFCTETKIPPGKRDRKLLATVESKERYVIHYVALQQALKHGLVLEKIHRVLKFKQSRWLKPFIDLNTAKRTVATNTFDKDFYKNLSNSIYGKTMEGVRNRLDIRLVSNPQKLEKLIAKPNFIDRTIYNENLASVHMRRIKVVFNKPIFIGMSVLDISKTHMYNFFYDVLKPFYGDKVRLCYQDTDSLLVEIETEDLYEDLNHFSEHMDTSDYPVDHPLYSLDNKKKLGKFKDEAFGDILTAYVGLRCKMYAFKRRNHPAVKKLKGIRKSVIKKIKFRHYVKCLYSGRSTYTANNLIQSRKHQVQTVTVNKITLSSDDDKRVIMGNMVSTLPYGHWRLEQLPGGSTDESPPAKKVKTMEPEETVTMNETSRI